METQEYAFIVIIERAGEQDHFSAYVPDAPGCVASGHSVEEARVAIREALGVHLMALRQEHQPIPPSRACAERITVRGEPARTHSAFIFSSSHHT